MKVISAAIRRPLPPESIKNLLEPLSFDSHQNALNPLTPNDHYSGRTAPLTSKLRILYIFSTNIGTEYFKHGIYSPFFSLQNAVFFHNSNVFGSCIIHI